MSVSRSIAILNLWLEASDHNLSFLSSHHKHTLFLISDLARYSPTISFTLPHTPFLSFLYPTHLFTLVITVSYISCPSSAYFTVGCPPIHVPQISFSVMFSLCFTLTLTRYRFASSGWRFCRLICRLCQYSVLYYTPYQGNKQPFQICFISHYSCLILGS